MDALPGQRDQLPGSAFRRDLRVKVAWALLAKVLALTVLWLLFFRDHAP